MSWSTRPTSKGCRDGGGKPQEDSVFQWNSCTWSRSAEPQRCPWKRCKWSRGAEPREDLDVQRDKWNNYGWRSREIKCDSAEAGSGGEIKWDSADFSDCSPDLVLGSELIACVAKLHALIGHQNDEIAELKRGLSGLRRELADLRQGECFHELRRNFESRAGGSSQQVLRAAQGSSAVPPLVFPVPPAMRAICDRDPCFQCRLKDRQETLVPRRERQDGGPVRYKWGFLIANDEAYSSEGHRSHPANLLLQDIYTDQINIVTKDTWDNVCNALVGSPLLTHIDGAFKVELLKALGDGVHDGSRIQVGWHRSKKYATLAVQCIRCRFLCAAECYFGHAFGSSFWGREHERRVQEMFAEYLGLTTPRASGV